MSILIYITTVIWILLLSSKVDTLFPSDVIDEEYCTSERFEPSCPEGHVIIIESAKYGRMQPGRCISDDPALPRGCETDVTSALASKCSGRRTCSVIVGMMDSIAQPCAKDFKSYLQATHRCIHVRYARPCSRKKQDMVLSQSRGYIAPYSDRNYAMDGAELCTWIIQGQPGQKVNISLISLFSAADQSVYSSSPCRLRITISEGNTKNMFELCDLSTPYLLHSSRGHQVNVKIPYSARQTVVVQKILKYQIYGCPDISPSANSEVRRTGDQVVITCTDSSETWYFTCKDSQWVGKPENISCPQAPHSADSDDSDTPKFKHGITLAIVVGVALGTFMGACLLCLVYLAKRRHKRRPAQPESQYGGADTIQYEPGMRSASATTDRRPGQQTPNLIPAVMCQAKQTEPGVMEYTHVWGMHPPSICNERQYSSSTFSPTYDHSNCVPLQNYESTTLPAAGSGGSAGVKVNKSTCSKNNNELSGGTNIRNVSGGSGQDDNNLLNNSRTYFCELHGNV